MIEIDGLTRKTLIVATPMYGGNCTGFYLQGMMGLASLATSYGIIMRTIIVGDSLIPRGRNRCVDMFKSMTEDDPEARLMFIDADVQFNSADVLRLMLLEKDVVGALYPMKHINWKRVQMVLERNPEFPVEDLRRVASDYVFNVKLPPGETSGKIDISECTPVRDLGTGFLMIKRKVFDQLETAGLAHPFAPCMNEEIFSGPQIYDHFPCGIDTELGVGDENAYLSEDWIFCRRWQKLGGEVYACPWMKLTHHGGMAFEGDMAMIATAGVKIGEEYSHV